MPTVSDINLQLDMNDIHRAWQNRHGVMSSPAMLDRLSVLLTQVQTEGWLKHAISYEIFKVTNSGPGWAAIGNSVFKSPYVTDRLHDASHFVFGVCTLGEQLSQQIREWFDVRKQLQAVILDEIGTLALFKLARYFEILMRDQAASMGLQASGTLNPGDGDFDISLQRAVLELAGGPEIGVSLHGTGTLVPHKSLTAVMGFGREIQTWCRHEDCAGCRSRKNCPFRQNVDTEVAA